MGEDTKRIGEPGAGPHAGAPLPKKGRALRFGCLLFLALALLLVTINFLMSFLAREQFRRELEEAKKAGLPSSLSEMAPPQVALVDNAAPVYDGAFPFISAPIANEELAFAAFAGWKADRASEQAVLWRGRDYIDRNKAALDRLRQAMRLPHCRFDIDYAAGPAVRIPHHAELQKASMLWCMESRVLLAEGKTADALRSAAEVEMLAETLRGEPLLESMYCRIAIREMADEALRRALQEPQPDARALARLAEVLERTRDDEMYVLAAKGYRAMCLGYMEGVRAGRFSGLFRSGWVYNVFDWALYSDMGRLLRVMRKEVDLAKLTWSEASAESVKVEREIQQVPKWCILTRAIYANFTYRAPRKTWEKDHARHDAGRLAVALARHRLQHGAYPDSLDALAPDLLPSIPMDPFTGKPFGYRHAGDSARVYSMGPSGFDNGGGVVGQDDESTILWPLGDQTPFEGK